MIDLSNKELWFVTGSQHLYGEETLKQVASNSQEIAGALNNASAIPVSVVFKTVGETSETIRDICQEANNAKECIGLVIWCHTFSPAKMWIGGLKALKKPFVHLHTQFNRDLPWSEIDMDYMNLHQSAHGDREFGFICARMRIDRKVVVGHWQDPEVQQQIGNWSRAAAAHASMQGARICRIGDNMREVSVTEGDKVAAEQVLGYSVNGYGVGDVVAYVDAVSDAEVDALCATYESEYDVAPELLEGGAKRESLRDGARIELGLRKFLEERNAVGFTTTFEDLHGLKQLPGLAVQRLMMDGYGFGAEGDWKSAALLRTMKVMEQGLEGGTSFMEDYTYHLDPAGTKVLGSHMLEICPSIAQGKPKLECHPLGIGGKEDPVRLVFNVGEGSAVNATIIDLGDRFRFVVNEVDVVAPDADLPKLPVARAVWQPKPDFKTSAACWIQAGGSHHPIFSKALPTECLVDYATIAGIELVLIDEKSTVAQVKNELRFNDVAYKK
ncbi:L-arabinose isomerase [Pelagicoccus sp. SDUM812003]|uniref:L-arabinose isomerase n=1 Tax=Pelagicoccus sp. SDUM812003 TaxID=3041267 RepID=UPI00280EFE0E|nr:L-arabinose isomerase [Pelagicoccus sp. SDUM812003]MDQ8205492.1 L-arabinose isomerase [Pelagicoccus sp. SDUM812003]